jgi:hypothetical protein
MLSSLQNCIVYFVFILTFRSPDEKQDFSESFGMDYLS